MVVGRLVMVDLNVVVIVVGRYDTMVDRCVAVNVVIGPRAAVVTVLTIVVGRSTVYVVVTELTMVVGRAETTTDTEVDIKVDTSVKVVGFGTGEVMVETKVDTTVVGRKLVTVDINTVV
jgi:hypothetical protein